MNARELIAKHAHDRMDRNPIFFKDFYKVGHPFQYPDDVTQIWTNWTPRYTNVEGQQTIINFGLTRFIKKYLMETYETEFFSRPWESIRDEYREVMSGCLFQPDFPTDHIKAVHDLGYLPIRIYALPEGSEVPLGVPPVLITNTIEGFGYRWLPNMLETLMSSQMWKPSTSATTAKRFRKIFMKWAREAGETDFGFVDYMGHDFSMRGMSGHDDFTLSGMGHLLMFTGTDTIPAILEARRYYGAKLAGMATGGSVNATEHSVMCAGSQSGEFDTCLRLLMDVYKSGILSIVADTWNLWEFLTIIVPRLMPYLTVRDGKLVVRPDSGDPVNIVCGDPAKTVGPEAAGALRLLAAAMGTFERPGKLPLIGQPHPLYLNTGGGIYGDGISEDRADRMLGRIVRELKLSPYNQVFGIGSYTYEFKTRDTYGWAMKATAVRKKSGEVEAIFKKPITDDGGKFSHRGLLAVYNDGTYDVPKYRCEQNVTEAQLNNCEYGIAFEDGELHIDPEFALVRQRARVGL